MFNSVSLETKKNVYQVVVLFFLEWFFPLTHKQSIDIGGKMPHSKWSRTSFTLHDGTWAKAWQEERQVFGMVACLARLARLSATLFASRKVQGPFCNSKFSLSSWP